MDEKDTLEIVAVKWKDAASIDQWDDKTIHEEHEPPVIFSVGILLKLDDKKIVIALSQDTGDDSISQSLTIPIEMVQGDIETIAIIDWPNV